MLKSALYQFNSTYEFIDYIKGFGSYENAIQSLMPQENKLIVFYIQGYGYIRNEKDFSKLITDPHINSLYGKAS